MQTRSSSSSSSPEARGKKIQNSIDNKDYINNLPDDLLQTIISELSTEEAMTTSVLSTRWKDLWKRRPHLILDMRRPHLFLDISKTLKTTPFNPVHEVSVGLAKSISKVIKDHCGHLESCIIHYYTSCQYNDGILESWVHTLTQVKHTKYLTLVDHGKSFLYVLPNTFSHHSLTSLSLSKFFLIDTYAFNNCSNLKTLKILNVIVPQVSVLSRVFEACPSVEVLVLQIDNLTQSGVLKIENKNLKFLQFSSPHGIDRIELYATCLDVLDIRFIKSEKENFILNAPNIRFNRNYWIAGGSPHVSYNVSSLAQEKRSIWHELMVTDFEDMRRSGCLSVSVDLSNLKEAEILKEVLLMWTTQAMIELEILFKKNNAPRKEEGKCSRNGRGHKKLWGDAKPFSSASFRVYVVWMYNFDGLNKEEFALASHFVTHKMMIEKVMIETSSYPPLKKLEVEACVAKLRKLPKGNEDLSIQCF